MEKFDLTIIGAGFSGVCAAIAAARNGLKVALIGDRPVFGGNSSSEMSIGINGAAQNGHSPSVYSREGGIVEELKLAMSYYKSRDIAYFELVYKEPNITSFLNTLVTDVEMDGDKIKAVTAIQLASELHFRFESPLFIDSSGDGLVANKAGAEFMRGREAKSEFNESLAPDVADDYTLGGTILFASRYTDRKITFRRPAFAHDIVKMPFYKNLGKGARSFHRGAGKEFNGFWWTEYGGQVDTIKDNEAIALELRKIAYGLWDYIKNSGNFEDVDNLELVKVTQILGKRESRRFIGETIVTQNDVDNKVDFPDSVGMAGWEMDVHAPKGIYDDEPATFWHFVAGNFNIPFGMMVPKKVPNLMFAGRNMSATHVAFGATRLAATGGVAGQVVGTAAYLCKKYGKTPSEIRQDHISELVTMLLNADQSIVNRKEPKNEELYKDLTIKASSTKEYENTNIERAALLDRDIGQCFPIKTRLDSYKIKVKNSGSETVLKVSVYGGNQLENYIPESLIKTIDVEIPEKFDDWVTIPINEAASSDQKLYVLYSENKNLSLYSTNDRLTGTITFFPGEGDPLTSAKYKGCMRVWRTRENHANTYGYEICFKELLPRQDMYSVENLLNDYTRPYGLPNIWISNPDKTAEIEINYSVPKKLKEIQLVFNTMLEEDNIEELDILYTVKDYTLEIETDDGKIFNHSVTDNFTRVNYIKQDLENVIKIKLKLNSTYGSKYFEMYGIKMF